MMNDNDPRKTSMDSPDLGGLRTMPIPAASEEKRVTALAAAMVAFESAGAAQGNADQPRLNIRELDQTRSTKMSTIAKHMPSITARRLMPLAATVCIAALVAPFAMQMMREKAESETPRTEVSASPTLPEQRSPGDRLRQEQQTAQNPGPAAPPPLAAAPKQDERKPMTVESLRIDQRLAHTRSTDLLLRAPTGAEAASPAPPAPATGNAVGRVQGVFTPGAKDKVAGNDTGMRLQRPAEPAIQPTPEEGRDRFTARDANPVRQVAQEPVSTFSIDVDTTSYSFARRALNGGRLPQKAAVRVEEMINYFPYAYAAPESADQPLRPSVTVMPSPWNAANQIVHIGIKGYDIPRAIRPRANIVLLVDISGSMAPADRLPLLKNGFRMLVETLDPEDVVSIVTYAAGSDIRLQPTKAKDKDRILAAIDSLNAQGSTHGAQGILDAYRVAEANFDKTGVNRIILGTDGDFNVGITNPDELKSFVERKRDSGIFLSVLGVGRGNYNDTMMQALAQNGNGVASYVDTLNEARKVLVDQASSTLFPIAKDVKIQVEFNPSTVSAYRLIGYEKRALKREDFNNDKVDAGETGSGHTITAIYEITRTGQAQQPADALRYQPQGRSAEAAPPATAQPDELAFLKIRYKLPKEETSRLMTQPILASSAVARLADAPVESRFGVAVAGFGQLLGGSPHIGRFGHDEIIALANGAKGEDAFGYRAEFVNLVRLAKTAQP
jgi:Ca-activated chloride channel homolog